MGHRDVDEHGTNGEVSLGLRRPAVARTLLVAALLGVALWALSPWMTGQREPWDAGGWFYPGALLLTGLVAGAISPRPLWAHYCGNVVGQVLGELMVAGLGPLFLLGLGFLAVYALLFVTAAFVAARGMAFLAARHAGS